MGCRWSPRGCRCVGAGLAVAGRDLYVAGNEMAGYDYTTFEEINRAYVWKNGEAQSLETISPNNFSLWGIACAFVEAQE